MKTLRAYVPIVAMVSAIGPALAQAPSMASCLVGDDKVALAAGVRADTVNNLPECHLTWQQAGIMIGFPAALDKQVTPDNLFKYPFVRWTLQSTSHFTRTAPMLSDRPKAIPIPQKPKEFLLHTELSVNGVNHTVAEYADRTFTDALIFVKDDNVVAEWYGDGMSVSKPHYISSVTKGVTGLLAELLIGTGKLDETRPVKSYVPELTNSPFGDATVREMLDMKVNVGAGETSGAIDVADAALWSTMALNSRLSVYETLAAVKADGPNDGHFHYASMTTEVAGWVITRAANEPYEQLASDLLWSRLGLQDDIYGPVDPAGKIYSSTGLTISARDLAKLGLMIADHGKVDGKQVFPANVIDRLFKPGDEDAWKSGTFKIGTPFRSYRSYWYQFGGEDHAIVGLGVFGQALYIDPTRHIVMVRFSSMPAHSIIEYARGWDEIRVWLDEKTSAQY